MQVMLKLSSVADKYLVSVVADLRQSNQEKKGLDAEL